MIVNSFTKTGKKSKRYWIENSTKLENELKASDKKIEELENKVKKLQKDLKIEKDKLNKIKKSKSWKITEPLRKIKRKLTRK